MILKGHVAKDHVHRLLSYPPALSPAKVVQYLKGRSLRLLQQEFSHLRKRHWGKHLWARGYFCLGVGEAMSEQIREYIEKHRLPDAVCANPGHRRTRDLPVPVQGASVHAWGL